MKCLLTLILLIQSTCYGQNKNLPGKQVFFDSATAYLKNNSIGYGFTLFQNGKKINQSSGGWAVYSNNGKTRIPFTSKTVVHVASLSKLLTAAATLKVVALKKLSLETPISKLLPNGWSIHPTINKIRISDLLAMKSGIDAANDALTSGLDSLQSLIARGIDTSNYGKYNYRNANYGLLRVIIGQLLIPPAYNEANEEVLHYQINHNYQEYINSSILQPIGISKRYCHESFPNEALMYSFPLKSMKGLLTGSGTPEGGYLLPYAGGLGWYLCLDDLNKLTASLSSDKSFLTKDQKKYLWEMGTLFGPVVENKIPFMSEGLWLMQRERNVMCGVNACIVFLEPDLAVTAVTNSVPWPLKYLSDTLANIYKQVGSQPLLND